MTVKGPEGFKQVTFFLASMEGGGIQRATMRLLREFQRRNIRTTLVVANGEGPVRKDVPEGCDLVDLQSNRVRNAVIPLLRYLLKNKPQSGVSSQTHLNVLMIVLRVLTGYPKQLVVREHNTFVEETIRHGRFSERMRPWLIQFFYPMASAFVAVSNSVAKSIIKFAGYKKDIRVITNGIDLDEIGRLKNQSTEKAITSRYQEKKLIVGMGRLSNQKNFSLLLNAFARVGDADSHLLIMGEGEERESLKELSRILQIEEKVDFAGFVENPYPILAQAKVFVLSSKWEGFCNVVIEALACGVPIVSTDCPGGPAEFLAGKPFARVVPMENPERMANAIKELINLPFNSQQIVDFSKQFSVNDVAQHYIELFSELG